MKVLANYENLCKSQRELELEQGRLNYMLSNRVQYDLTKQDWAMLQNRLSTVNNIIKTLDSLDDYYQILLDTNKLRKRTV